MPRAKKPKAKSVLSVSRAKSVSHVPRVKSVNRAQWSMPAVTKKKY